MLKETKISPFYGDLDHHSLKKIITFTSLKCSWGMDHKL